MATRVGVEHELLVFGDRVWGRGVTEKEAMKKCKEAGGHRPSTYLLYLVPKGASVNSMGGIEWKGEWSIVLLKFVKDGKELPPTECP